MSFDRQGSKKCRAPKHDLFGRRSADLDQTNQAPQPLFGRNNFGTFLNPAPLNVSMPVQPTRAQQPARPANYQPIRNRDLQFSQEALARSNDSIRTNLSQGARYAPANILEKYTVKPAPKDQYKKYMQKSENIFYEDRFQAKLAMYLRWLIRFVLLLTGCVLLCYASVSMVTPYQGPVPRHGYVRNKVLYCDFGYRLVGNQCILDESINLEAEQLAIGVVTDLRLQYGEADCTPGTAGYPNRNMRELINKNERLQERKATLLQQQVSVFLSDPNNKRDYKFEYDGVNVWPTEKLHSYTCRVKLFLESGLLWKILLGVLAILAAAWFAYNWYEQEQLAQRIYSYLKTRVYEKGTIKIDEEREAMEQIGHVDEKMWDRIDKLRTKEQQIGFFQDDSIYWRRV